MRCEGVVSPVWRVASGFILRQAQDEVNYNSSTLILSLTKGEGAVPGRGRP